MGVALSMLVCDWLIHHLNPLGNERRHANDKNRANHSRQPLDRRMARWSNAMERVLLSLLALCGLAFAVSFRAILLKFIHINPCLFSKQWIKCAKNLLSCIMCIYSSLSNYPIIKSIYIYIGLDIWSDCPSSCFSWSLVYVVVYNMDTSLVI